MSEVGVEAVPGAYNRRSDELVWSWLKRACRRSSFLRRGLEISGNVASFATWQAARGLDDGKCHATREGLWQTVTAKLQRGKVTVLEFGVASGDVTRWWLSAVRNSYLDWHGFDTFTGLPDPWARGGIQFADVGTFDAGGKPR